MLVTFFICKQKTAYEMRISDWSSDVCSSDFVRAHLVSSIEGPDPTAASVTFLGVEPLDVLRFESPDGLVRYITLGCSRHPMGDPNELVADRSEELRVGKECVRRGRSRWSSYP